MPDNWLELLKAGDIVIYDAGWSRNQFSTATVERTTVTQVVVDGKRFRRSDGIRMRENNSYGWRRSRILEPTQDRLDIAMRSTLSEKASRMKVESLSLDQLRRIGEILDEPRSFDHETEQ